VLESVFVFYFFDFSFKVRGFWNSYLVNTVPVIVWLEAYRRAESVAFAGLFDWGERFVNVFSKYLIIKSFTQTFQLRV